MSTKMVLLLVKCLILLTIILNGVFSWKLTNLPKYYGHRVPHSAVITASGRVQRRIVMMHDYFRTKVQPPASNMLSMRWHKGAARNAQIWAEQCRFLTHDPPENRAVYNFDACGQNIFVSTHLMPWFFVLKSWFIENQNFTYGSQNNDPSVVGHYTQMVWAATHKVGCGVTKCRRGGPHGKPFYNYVCNYCPAGNYPHQLPTPYKAGPQCSACPNHCRSNKIRLCTNSCNVADRWSNCNQLFSKSPSWLCGKDQNNQNCRATCNCRGKIYD